MRTIITALGLLVSMALAFGIVALVIATSGCNQLSPKQPVMVVKAASVPMAESFPTSPESGIDMNEPAPLEGVQLQELRSYSLKDRCEPEVDQAEVKIIVELIKHGGGQVRFMAKGGREYRLAVELKKTDVPADNKKTTTELQKQVDQLSEGFAAFLAPATDK